MNWVDIVIIAVVVLAVLVGVFRGFTKTLLSMVSNSLVFLASFLLCKPTAKWLMKITTWDNSLCSKITNWLSKLSPAFDKDMVGMSGSEITKHINSTLSTKGFPKFFKFIFKITTNITPESLANKTSFTLNQFISQTLTILTFILVCFVIYIIVFFIVKYFLNKLTDTLSFKFETYRKTDKILGAVFGLIRGFCWVFIIFAFYSIFRGIPLLKTVNNAISSSGIGKPLTKFIYKIVDKYFNITSMVRMIQIIV